MVSVRTFTISLEPDVNSVMIISPPRQNSKSVDTSVSSHIVLKINDNTRPLIDVKRWARLVSFRFLAVTGFRLCNRELKNRFLKLIPKLFGDLGWFIENVLSFQGHSAPVHRYSIRKVEVLTLLETADGNLGTFFFFF